MSDANKRQVGGEHYLKYGGIQPWDVWLHWNLNPFQAMAIKYIVRYRDKNGVQDLEKAKHYLDKLIEVEEARLIVAKPAAKHRDCSCPMHTTNPKCPLHGDDPEL